MEIRYAVSAGAAMPPIASRRPRIACRRGATVSPLFVIKSSLVRHLLHTTAISLTFCIAAASLLAQSPPEPRPQLAEEIFKNIQVLKGVPVNQFLGIMGFFSASLGKSCVDCHDSDSGWENYVSDTNPNKKTARRMIAMVSAINKNFFGGRQTVTCYSCHRGGPDPKPTPDLAALYSPPAEEQSKDVVQPAPNAPPVDKIFGKYVQAIGGAERVARLASFAAKGTSVGYGLDQDNRPVEIYARAPDQRATIVHTPAGDSIIVHDGRSGWIAGPNLPLSVLPLSGGDLEGAKLDAELSFPARIQQFLRDWRVGVPSEIGDLEVQVVQGTTPGGELVTLYFDMESGFLVRVLRYTSSPVGRMPTQIDYSDYREVAGVKMAFKWTTTWLDGREAFELTDVQPNVSIDPGKFVKPAPVAQPKR
jgi:photosynthetic reaction center cytochrome c subunit